MKLETTAMHVPLAAAAVIACALLAACGSSPKRPYGSSSSTPTTKTLAEQCRDAEFYNRVPPPGCPQTASTTRQRTLPDLPIDSPGGLGLPGGAMSPVPRLPR